MTPAEMREAAAALVERCEWYATASLGRLARPPSQTVGPLVLLAAANLKIAVGCSALGV